MLRGRPLCGQGRNRTTDTVIFSHLAWARALSERIATFLLPNSVARTGTRPDEDAVSSEILLTIQTWRHRTKRARMARTELGNRCSIQLSYGTACDSDVAQAPVQCTGLSSNPLSRPRPQRRPSTSPVPWRRRPKLLRGCSRGRAHPRQGNGPGLLSRLQSDAAPPPICR